MGAGNRAKRDSLLEGSMCCLFATVVDRDALSRPPIVNPYQPLTETLLEPEP